MIDIEHVSSFVGMRHERMTVPRTKRLIAKALGSSRCVGILPHCEAARKTMSVLGNDARMLDKCKVVYPAVDASLFEQKRTGSTPTRILFMGEYLWKGGRELLQACSELSGRLDFSLQYISLRVHPPEEVVEKARRSMKIDFVKGPIQRRELLERVYPSTDVFVMPTYIDTFGYAFLEAMAFGIPCIGTRHFAVPEIIEHEVSGLLVEPPLSFFDRNGMGQSDLDPGWADNRITVEGLKSALSSLLESTALRNNMGARARQTVLEGKFSVARRNSILKEVYESGLKH
ncbi:MAG: hypothetical protein A3K60_07350 [Euryarchaeota archaeon RBG_19FT_COMBO_56_21]|nr:MAG: hypothetical protein A3K60_07350 [Euryarchaeota archaeon RBG_19FT_COMBO_56_21]